MRENNALWGPTHKFTYTLTYDHSDVVVSLDGESKNRIKSLLDNNLPDGSFKKALESFVRKFHSQFDEFPWQAHPRGNEIEKAVSKKWPLAWYWKALLPTLKHWKPDCENQWRVAICQIRQWVMVLIYEYINGVQHLLRPPLFGPSERISQDDQYWLLLSFKKDIEKAWSVAVQSTGQERAFEEEYVLGRHDVIYKLCKVESIENLPKYPKLKVTLQSQLILDPHIDTEDNFPKILPKILKLEGKYDPDPHDIRNPYSLLRLPTMNLKSSEHEDVQLLLSSDNVCQSVQKLSEIWNDPTSKSIFILAPPGSGKEILARSIYNFRPFEGEYISFALSPDPNLSEANQKMLFYRDMSDAEASAEAVAMINQELKDDASLVKNIRDGFIFKTRKGVLFLDEIDKEKKDSTRASLLRLLENDEFAIFDTTMVVKMSKNIAPVYVFAGSKPSLQNVLELEPKDFWTRISHIVEMKHPLDLSEENERLKVCSAYFIMFWNRHLPKFFQRSALLPISFRPKGERDKKSKRFLHKYVSGIFWALMNEDVKQNLSKLFSKIVLSKRSSVEVSIRNIRSVVGRIAFSLVELVLYDPNFGRPLAKIRENLANFPDSVSIKDDLHWHILLARLIANKPIDKSEFGFRENMRSEDKTEIEAFTQQLSELTNSLQDEIKDIVEKSIILVLPPKNARDNTEKNSSTPE